MFHAVARRNLSAGLASIAMIVALMLVPMAAKSDQAAAFHQALSSAYGHYREAFFYLRRDNAMTAAFELEMMAGKWRALHSAFAKNPPKPYAGDTAWASTLAAVGAIAGKAQDQAEEGNAPEAYELLKPVRGILADLRRRNGITLFRDRVEAANTAFTKLYDFRHHPPDFSDPKNIELLRQRLTATIAAYKICRKEASPETLADERFTRLIDDSLYYLDRIWLAIEQKNQLNVVNILRRVVSSDEILWMRFG